MLLLSVATLDANIPAQQVTTPHTESERQLVKAAKAADKTVLRVLLQQNVNVNTPDVDGTTALHWATHHDDVESAELLIRAGADVRAADRYGVTPLSLACTNGSAVMIEKLLRAGADPNSVLPEGETALMTAARVGNPDAVNVLLAHKANVNARESWRGQTALMWAVAQKHAAVARALIEHGADVNARSNSGFTPLLFAVRMGDMDSARLLLSAGANANDAAPDGSSVLIVAITNARYELAAFLLDNDADANADHLGWTPLHAAILARNPGTGPTPNTPTGSMDSLECIEALLAHGADPDARSTARLSGTYTFLNTVGATPFLLAAVYVDVLAMRTLLRGGADPLIATTTHTTPLMAAAGIGFDEGSHTGWSESAALAAVKLALEPGGDVNAVDDLGNTALHGAALTGANSVINFLAEKGARLDVKNKQGWLPVTIADGVYDGFLYKFRPEAGAALRKLMAGNGPGK